MYKKILNKLKNKKVAIVGFGREGKSTYNFIRKYFKNQMLFILDKNVNLISDFPFLLNDKNVTPVLGDNYLNNLEFYDVIIKTPGLSFKDIDITLFKDKITSEVNLLLENCNCQIIGVTGTKGKSTTSSLIYKIIKDQGYDAYLCGNIGIPVFDYIDKLKKDSIVVVEMSAYHTQFIKKSPHISVILNLFEEHLDFFGSKELYFNSKLNLFKYQNKNDFALYSFDNDTLKDLINLGKYKANFIRIESLNDVSLADNDSIVCDEKNIYVKNNDNLTKLYNIDDERYLLGRHNVENIMFALGVSVILKLNISKVIKSINDFKPLEHRMEFVGIFNNIKFYNDSIATIPEATINCINTLNDVNTLIFGGLDRKIDYSSFIDYLMNSNIENFICLPDTGYKIGKKLKNKKVFFVETIADAVKIAYTKTKKEKICLLSPAASSYNRYKSFEEKGNDYKNCIKKYSD